MYLVRDYLHLGGACDLDVTEFLRIRRVLGHEHGRGHDDCRSGSREKRKSFHISDLLVFLDMKVVNYRAMYSVGIRSGLSQNLYDSVTWNGLLSFVPSIMDVRPQSPPKFNCRNFQRIPAPTPHVILNRFRSDSL